MRIRAMRAEDLEPIRAIEVRAGALFRQVGKDDIAEHPVPPATQLVRYVDAGRVWVLVDDEDAPVGFVLVDRVDGLAHIEQVSVDPSYARQGLGRAMIDHVGSWAVTEKLPALTLTTFRDVPWNAPYYERLGFAQITEFGPELAALLDEEARHGLVPAERVAMIKPVDIVPRETNESLRNGFASKDLFDS